MELGSAFSSRIPAELRATLHAELDDELRALIERARADAPGIALDPLAFVAYVAERVGFGPDGPQLRTLHAGDLWIAFGCVTGNPAASGAFHTRFLPDVRAALGRAFDPGLAHDAELQLMTRMLLVADDGSGLASYAGRGGLKAWLRAAAVRGAIDLMRARRELPVDPTSFGDIGGDIDPLLASLKQHYRDEFRVAFGDAAKQLTDRERTLLRYRFFDGLTIDEIGALYRVHRATAARWLAAIRETLFETTRANLVAKLVVSEAELDSVLRLIDSQLDISIETAIR